MLIRIDRRNPRMMPLEMQTIRRNDPMQVLPWRHRRGRGVRRRRSARPADDVPLEWGRLTIRGLRNGAPCSFIHTGTCGGRLSSAASADGVGRAAEAAPPASTTPPASNLRRAMLVFSGCLLDIGDSIAQTITECTYFDAQQRLHFLTRETSPSCHSISGEEGARPRRSKMSGKRTPTHGSWGKKANPSNRGFWSRTGSGFHKLGSMIGVMAR